MDDEPYRAITGKLVLLGKSPDGDSVRFIADDAAALRALRYGYRLQPSKDKSVQLRLDAIDAPETHYSGKAQPLGDTARDIFLQALGFTNVVFSSKGTVNKSTPEKLPATILAKMVEVHGRPVCYLFVGEHQELKGVREVALTIGLLARSVNAVMAQKGLAYPTLYTSTPLSHREFFTDLAAKARKRPAGVWKSDKTRRFMLTDQDSIGPEGQLIFPKLFRRCSDYLTDKAKGFEGTFLDWLTQASDDDISEDDELFVITRKTNLSKIISEKGKNITCSIDLLDIVFIEK